MATYLQGVTDYIPDYQPFQPDLNFYNNYLQTKQDSSGHLGLVQKQRVQWQEILG